MGLPQLPDYRRVLAASLEEDIGIGDVTTLATVPAEATTVGLMVAREDLVLAGGVVAESAFRECSPDLRFELRFSDGEEVKAEEVILRVQGNARAILTAERVALNWVQRLSGIATLTREYVRAVRGNATKILDTRKTTPGLRALEKYAVTCGGGHNHRMGLYDQALIKDNHLAVLRDARPNAIAAAIGRIRQDAPGVRVEVEADTLEQVAQAADAGADIILLDNLSLEDLRLAVELVGGRALLEASGGVQLASVADIARTGVDHISVGALTHSARAMDIALDSEQSLEDHHGRRS